MKRAVAERHGTFMKRAVAFYYFLNPRSVPPRGRRQRLCCRHGSQVRTVQGLRSLMCQSGAWAVAVEDALQQFIDNQIDD